LPSRPGLGSIAAMAISGTDLASAVESYATAVGIGVGGVFTYYKFVKDRIYRPRLDLSVIAERVESGDRTLLACRLAVHNLGSTKLSIRHKGLVLIVRAATVPPGPFQAARWSSDAAQVAVVRIFADHDWIESGETIRDEALVSVVADPAQAYRVELRFVVVHPSPRSKKNITVYGAVVVAGSAAEPKLSQGAAMTSEQHSESTAPCAPDGSPPPSTGGSPPSPPYLPPNRAPDQFAQREEDPEETIELESQTQDPRRG
jgi:hypothetical protein